MAFRAISNGFIVNTDWNLSELARQTLGFPQNLYTEALAVWLRDEDLGLTNEFPEPEPLQEALTLYQLTRDGVVLKSHPTGSRYICNPPVMDTDEDYICLVESLNDVRPIMAESGYKEGGSVIEHNGEIRENFISYRSGTLNLILTDYEDYYDAFVKCTECAKDLNLLNKADRIRLFEFGMEGFE